MDENLLGSEPVAPWISIVLPAHNEAPHIGHVAADFLLAARSLGKRAEVIVVDDASSDGTSDAVYEKLDRNDPDVVVVRRESQGGYGAALLSGFSAARGTWVFFTDGDGQFSGEDLPGFLQGLEEDQSDMILGYRHPRQDRLSRRALGKAWTLMMRQMFRVKVRDMNCAYKVIRRSSLDAMKLKSRGALINAEMLHKARRMNLSNLQRPVRHLERSAGEATGARPEVIARALFELARYRVQTLMD